MSAAFAKSQSMRTDSEARNPNPRFARRLAKLALAVVFGCAVSSAFPSAATARTGIVARPASDRPSNSAASVSG
jgi:hypothetical protein